MEKSLSCLSSKTADSIDSETDNCDTYHTTPTADEEEACLPTNKINFWLQKVI